jgi:hypothetical protein
MGGTVAKQTMDVNTRHQRFRAKWQRNHTGRTMSDLRQNVNELYEQTIKETWP